MFGGPNEDQDDLFHEAKEAILESGKASASYLQRRLRVGYARAARLLDELEQAGIIGPGEGAKPRDILVTKDDAYTTMNAGQQLNVYKDSIPVPQKKQEEWPKPEQIENTDNPLWDVLPKPSEEKEEIENTDESDEFSTDYRDIDENAMLDEDEEVETEVQSEKNSEEDEEPQPAKPKSSFYY
jgi:DNA segregation ATPase FtsK/SpoIIIE-like protein